MNTCAHQRIHTIAKHATQMIVRLRRWRFLRAGMVVRGVGIWTREAQFARETESLA